MLKFNVKNQSLTRLDDFEPATESQDYLEAKLNFLTDDWEGKTVTAVFSAPSLTTPLTEERITEEGILIVPAGALHDPFFVMSVFGTDDGTVRITTNAIRVDLNKSGYAEGETPPEPEPDVYTRIMAAAEAAAEDAAEAKGTAESAIGRAENAEEIAQAARDAIPTALSQLTDDSTHRTVTDTEKSTWNGAVPSSQKGAAGGVAELDASGKVPAAQLPSYVDDVVEYESTADFPQTGESGKIYVAKNTNKTYRWGGSGYISISSDLALGETASSAYRGDRGKSAYDHSQIQSGNPHHVSGSDIGITSENWVFTKGDNTTVTKAVAIWI